MSDTRNVTTQSDELAVPVPPKSIQVLKNVKHYAS